MCSVCSWKDTKTGEYFFQKLKGALSFLELELGKERKKERKKKRERERERDKIDSRYGSETSAMGRILEESRA